MPKQLCTFTRQHFQAVCAITPLRLKIVFACEIRATLINTCQYVDLSGHVLRSDISHINASLTLCYNNQNRLFQNPASL